ncbi:MAG: hypothetical protein MK101_07930 [Phycisphaerales bacterium]|nr:hypothetical protein [Phycisphaerales bacterium]
MRLLQSVFALNALSALLLAGFTCPAMAQEKPRVAVQKIEATPAVMQRARGDGASVANVLEQIMQGAQSDLENAMLGTGMFEVTSGSELRTVLDAQDLQNSGLFDEDDPATARPFQLAGFNYIATVTVNNFQLIDRRDVVDDTFGPTLYIFETIQLGAVVQVHDVTKGTLLASTDVVSEHSQETRIIEGSRQDGSYTSSMIGTVSRDLATDAAAAILDTIAPARVIEFQEGVIWMNRGRGAGVAVGDIFRVLDPGRVLRDPTTGAVLGSSESLNGWAVITDVQDKYSVAEAISLKRAPSVGHSTMRGGQPLPESLLASMRASGPFEPPARRLPPAPDLAMAWPNAQDADDAQPNRSRSVSIALFVDNVAEQVPDDRVSTLERQLQSMLADKGIRVIARRDVLDAVSTLNTGRADAGTGDVDQTEAQRVLSDQASVVSLARTLGADGIMTATIVSGLLDTTVSRQTQRIVAKAQVDVAWSLLEGYSGATLDGGLVDADERFIASDERVRLEVNTIDRLLREAASEIADDVQASLAAGRGPNMQLAPPSRSVEIVASLQNMTVPEIKAIDGVWTITGDRYPLAADACMLSIDGVMVGSTPGPIQIQEGTVRLRLEHPLCETVDRYVRIDDTTGTLRIPVVLSAEGRDEFERRTEFFEKLKDGAAMRENERAIVEGIVDFLERSSITIDTSQVRNLSIGQPSIWLQGLE